MKRSRLLIIGNLLFLFLFSGFSLFSSESKGKAFPLPGTFEEVWGATLATLKEEQVPLFKTDETNGYIQSQTFPLFKEEYRGWAKKPPFVGPGFCLVEIGVTKQTPLVTIVSVRAHFKRKNGFYGLGYRKNDPSRGVFEALLIGRINDHLIKKKYPKLKHVVFGGVFRFDENESRYVIADVDPKGLAYEAGLREGDILLKIEGKEITPANLFDWLLPDQDQGETTHPFTVKRGKEELVFPVTTFYLDPARPRSGMSVERRELSGKFEVTKVSPGSPAEEGGFQVGDVLLTENGLPFDDLRNYYRALISERNGEEQIFTLKRNGRIETRKVIPVSKETGNERSSHL